MAQGYDSTDMEIILLSDAGVYLGLGAQIGGYSSAQNAILDSRYMLELKFPDITMINRSHALDLTGLIYNDGLAAESLREMNVANDVEVTYALIHGPAGRFGPVGKAALGSTNLSPDNGIFSLTNSNPGSGKVEWRKLHQIKGVVSTGITISATPSQIYAHIKAKGTATSVTLKFTIASDEYEIAVDLTTIPSFALLTPLNGTTEIPSNSPGSSLTVEVAPTSAVIDLDLGIELQ